MCSGVSLSTRLDTTLSCRDHPPVCRPSETDVLQSRLSNCLDAVSSWMAANRLQLNSDKTEALWCSSVRRQYQIPTRPVRVGCTSVQPVTVVRNLGIWMATSACALTLLQLSGHALPSYAKYAVCIVPCHVQPC